MLDRGWWHVARGDGLNGSERAGHPLDNSDNGVLGGVSSITQELTWKFWQVEVMAMWQEPTEMDAFNLGNEELNILGEQDEH